MMFLVTLTACGGGSGKGHVDFTYQFTASYKTTDNLPEGLYITYAHPFTKINNMEVRSKKNCVITDDNDCVLYSGSPELLPDTEKYYVAATGQTYYRLSDLTDNVNLSDKYEYDMTFESYNYKHKKSELNEQFWRFEESLPSDKRVWVMHARNSERHFWVENNTEFTFEYALIRFTDTYYLNNFEMWDDNELDITERLQSFFEPRSDNYHAHSWSELYDEDFEVINVSEITPFDMHLVDAVPPGLTCVVPLLYGEFNAPIGWSGCQYNLNTTENIHAQYYRDYNLQFSRANLYPF